MGRSIIVPLVAATGKGNILMMRKFPVGQRLESSTQIFWWFDWVKIFGDLCVKT